MRTKQIEINLRIGSMQVHHALKRRIQMRVMNRTRTMEMLRRIMAVQRQVRIRIIVVGQLPYMRQHVAVHLPLFDRSFGRHIQRHRS